MTTNDRIIPRHEPEVVRAEADRRWRGDDEKVATTSLSSMVVNGILLNSRYGKADEYEEMAAIADALPAHMAGRVHSIFRDSQSGHTTVSMPAWDRDLALCIGHLMEEVCISLQEGHGGITLSEGAELLASHPDNWVEIAAGWVGDFIEP